MVSIDGSRFKLFTPKVLSKSVQASFCERPRNTRRTLFLLFKDNSCFQTGSAEWFGPAQIVLKISALINLSETYRFIPLPISFLTGLENDVK